MMTEGQHGVGVTYVSRTVKWQVEVNGVQESGAVRMKVCEGANYRDVDEKVNPDEKRVVSQSNAAWLREYGKRLSARPLNDETPPGSNEPDSGGFAGRLLDDVCQVIEAEKGVEKRMATEASGWRDIPLSVM